MAMTEIPPLRPRVAPTEAGEASRILIDAPVLLVQLQDDLARSRLREPFWISVVVHLIIVIALALSPKYLMRPAVVLRSAEDLLRQQELNFIELPPDAQKVTVHPKTNKVS